MSAKSPVSLSSLQYLDMSPFFRGSSCVRTVLSIPGVEQLCAARHTAAGLCPANRGWPTHKQTVRPSQWRMSLSIWSPIYTASIMGLHAQLRITSTASATARHPWLRHTCCRNISLSLSLSLSLSRFPCISITPNEYYTFNCIQMAMVWALYYSSATYYSIYNR